MTNLFTPKKLHIQNFCSIAEEQTFTFREGLFFIQGINEDSTTANSNGSGKSLLIEALCWALWGKTLREFKLDDEVINRHVGRDCRVRLEFSLGGVDYEVVRKRGVVNKYEKRNDLLFYVNGVPASGNSMAETQQQIIGVLGSLTFDTFSLMMPGARADLAQMTHGQIVQALEELLMLEHLVTARKKLSTDLKNLQREAKELTSSRDTLNAENDVLLAKRTALSQELLLREKEKLVSQYATVVEQEQKLKQQQTLLNEAQTQEDALLLSLSKISDLVSSLTQEQTLYKQRLGSILAERELALGHFEGDIAKLKKQQEAAIQQQGKCTLCGGLVNEQHKQQHIDQLQDQIDKLVTQQQITSNKYTDLVVETKALQEKTKARLEEALHDKKATQEKQSSWSAQLNMFRSTVTTTTKDVLRQRTEVTALLAQIDRQLTDLATRSDEIEQQCAELSQEIREIDKTVEALRYQENHMEFWYDSLDLEGFRVHVLISVLPYLTARAQHYASILTDGELSISFLPKKNSKTMFHVHVVNTNGAAVYNGFSKGEKGKVNLAVSLAIADLAANVSSTKLSFRFFDEAFDGIDKTGMTLLVSLLNEQAKDHRSIYVISHNPDIEGMISNVVTVRKKKDTTYIEDNL